MILIAFLVIMFILTANFFFLSFFFFSPNSADKDAQKGKKSARKTTRAGGSGMDLHKIAQEQQAKLEKVKEEREEQKKTAQEVVAAAPPNESPPAPAPSKAPVKTEPKATKSPEQSKTAHHRPNEQMRKSNWSKLT